MLGNTTYYGYDGLADLDSLGLPVFGNLTSIITSTGETHFGYDPQGNLKEILANAEWRMDENGFGGELVGVKTTFEYNAFGDLEKTISPEGVERLINHDNNGNQSGTSFTWVNPANPNDTRLVTTSAVPDPNDQITESFSASGVTRKKKTDCHGL